MRFELERFKHGGVPGRQFAFNGHLVSAGLHRLQPLSASLGAAAGFNDTRGSTATSQ